MVARRAVHQLHKGRKHFLIRPPFTAPELVRSQPLFTVLLVRRAPSLYRRTCRIQTTRRFSHALAVLPQQQDRVRSAAMLGRLLSQSLQLTPHRSRNPHYALCWSRSIFVDTATLCDGGVHNGKDSFSDPYRRSASAGQPSLGAIIGRARRTDGGHQARAVLRQAGTAGSEAAVPALREEIHADPGKRRGDLSALPARDGGG